MTNSQSMYGLIDNAKWQKVQIGEKKIQKMPHYDIISEENPRKLLTISMPCFMTDVLYRTVHACFAVSIVKWLIQGYIVWYVTWKT